MTGAKRRRIRDDAPLLRHQETPDADEDYLEWMLKPTSNFPTDVREIVAQEVRRRRAKKQGGRMKRTVEMMKVDRSPPYTVRYMTNAAGQNVYHLVAVDGFSIVATCYDEREARRLAWARTAADMQSTCVVCSAALLADDRVPHCMDTCLPTEEQEQAYLDEREAHRLQRDDGPGETHE